jgi:G3E family GTPase
MDNPSNVLSIRNARSPRPLPLLLVQGLPSFRTQLLLEQVKDSCPEVSITLLDGFPDLGAEDTCNQCALARFCISLIEERSREPRRPMQQEVIWLQVPAELDIDFLIETIEKIPSVQISSCITLIDGEQFLEDFSSTRSFRERFESLGLPPSRISRTALETPVLETWIDQIEKCEHLVVLGAPDFSTREVLSLLNPEADIIQEESLSDLLQDWVRGTPGTRRPSGSRETTRETRTGAGRFAASRPFHPQRFHDLVEHWPELLLRSKGTLWLASHPSLVLILNQIGPAGFFLTPEGYWPKVTPSALWRENSSSGNRIDIVFKSSEPLSEDWLKQLNRCLLTDLELRMDWTKFGNPFPSFEDSDGDDSTELVPYAPPDWKSSHSLRLISKEKDGGTT